MRHRVTGLSALILLATVGVAGPAYAAGALPETSAQLAQGSGGSPCVLTSGELRKMPEGLPLQVTTYDDSETNLEIKEGLAEALERNGFLVSDGAPLELSFKSEIIQGRIAERIPSLGRVGASNEQVVGNEGSERGIDVQVNIWSSSKDSVLGGRKSEAGSSRSPRFHINAQLRDLDDDRVIWQADALCEMLTSNEARIIKSMVGPIASSVGRTVPRSAFDIR